jgi:hypothetical protein
MKRWRSGLQPVTQATELHAREFAETSRLGFVFGIDRPRIRRKQKQEATL